MICRGLERTTHHFTFMPHFPLMNSSDMIAQCGILRKCFPTKFTYFIPFTSMDSLMTSKINFSVSFVITIRTSKISFISVSLNMELCETDTAIMKTSMIS